MQVKKRKNQKGTKWNNSVSLDSVIFVPIIKKKLEIFNFQN